MGNAIFDIIGGYGMEFVITFINKGAIALVTGLIAYKAAGKSPRGRGSRPRDRRQHPRRADLHRAVPAQILHQAALHHGGRRSRRDSGDDALKAASSLFNAAFAFVVAPIFFNVLRKSLRRLGLYSKD